MSARIVTLLLPFAPEERDAHDHAIAAAGALAAAAGADGLDVLQLVPASGAVAARASDGHAVRWCELVHPGITAEAPPSLLAQLAQEALCSDALRTARHRLVLLPSAPLAEETAALLAAAMGGATLGRCAAVTLEGGTVAATRLAFGGRLAMALRAEAPVCCATWRAPASDTATLRPLPEEARRRVALATAAPPEPASETLASADQQARLEGARLVVSGGRGVGGPEGFELLARLARQLGGALGGSLPAVDAGWVPVARQVGVSGKYVTPRLYFAVGISGTPQHLAGIAPASRIVALNTDPEAPIFRVADVGVVADWRELLPLLAQQLQAA